VPKVNDRIRKNDLSPGEQAVLEHAVALLRRLAES
jgi:hypothetical protein